MWPLRSKAQKQTSVEKPRKFKSISLYMYDADEGEYYIIITSPNTAKITKFVNDEFISDGTYASDKLLVRDGNADQAELRNLLRAVK